MSSQDIFKDNDSDFSALIGDIKTLSHDRVEPDHPKPEPHPRQTLNDEARVLQELTQLDYYDPELQPGDTIQYSRDGLQKQVLRKLKKGQFSVGGEIDLHGMRREEALRALKQFVLEAQQRDIRCVRIVHGKGYGSSNDGPVIKPLVNRWLRKQDQVLAFCSARPVDGGTGALYVLLKMR